jgi:hypothetical protein
MVSKYVEKYPTSLAVMEMKIKRTLRFRLIPAKMAVLKETKNKF